MVCQVLGNLLLTSSQLDEPTALINPALQMRKERSSPVTSLRPPECEEFTCCLFLSGGTDTLTPCTTFAL